MESTIKDNESDHDNKENSSSCPKCIPFTSSSKIAEKSKTSIEDQDADFVFKFISCRKCGYSEFYVVRDAVRKRI
jgi:predicted nucleic-acid-binding Zn-ribbon protein